jgi:hypothetical protein
MAAPVERRESRHADDGDLTSTEHCAS